jgi:hypothetical protein
MTMNNTGRQMLDDRSFIEPTRELPILPDRPEPERPTVVDMNIKDLARRWKVSTEDAEQIVQQQLVLQFPASHRNRQAWAWSWDAFRKDVRTWTLEEVERYEDTARALRSVLNQILR